MSGSQVWLCRKALDPAYFSSASSASWSSLPLSSLALLPTPLLPLSQSDDPSSLSDIQPEPKALTFSNPAPRLKPPPPRLGADLRLEGEALWREGWR